jgi:hypothetical protein
MIKEIGPLEAAKIPDSDLLRHEGDLHEME